MKCRLVYVSWLLEKKRNKGKGVKREWRIKENDQHQFSTTVKERWIHQKNKEKLS